MGVMTRFFQNRGVAPNSLLEAAAQSAAQPSRWTCYQSNGINNSSTANFFAIKP